MNRHLLYGHFCSPSYFAASCVGTPLDTFSDRTFNITTIASVLTLILATVLGPLERLLETTSLDVQQWLICICAGLAIVVVSEIRKAVRRRAAGPVPAGPESPAEG